MPQAIIENLTKDAPYLLKGEEERSRRKALLTLPHIAPLEDYLASIKARCSENCQIPHFDPCDGGIYARALFLLEAPGPQAIKTSFVSCDNPDPTAQNLWHLIHDAGIPRTDIVLWNIVPWYVGENRRIRPVTNEDIREAHPYLRELLDLLPGLQLIVLIGRKAQSTAPHIQTLTALPIVPTWHMSARVFNISPEKKQQTQEKFAVIAKTLQDNKEPHPCPNH